MNKKDILLSTRVLLMVLKTLVEILLLKMITKCVLFNVNTGHNIKKYTKNIFFNYLAQQWNIGSMIIQIRDR